MVGGGPQRVLEVRDLSVGFGGVAAVRNADLTVDGRGITALVGPSGCGKTSLLRAIAGFEEPLAGTVRIAGSVVSGPERWVPPERRRVGMVFQEGALFPHLTVRRNILYGLKGVAAADDRVAEVLELVGMGDLAERFPNELSGGQQQRVALARALAPSPRLVLLDEPFANLDENLRQRVREEVRSILMRAGATGLLVTHDQEEALSVADRVAVMDGGRILQEGSPEEIYHRPSSVAVARLIGDGQLVECTVAGGVARSLFGRASTDAPDGPAQIHVRPEDLAILPAAGEGGIRGVLEARRFFGHDLLADVRLSSGPKKGELVRVRLLSSLAQAIGDPVRIDLRAEEFQVFSTEDDARAIGRVRSPEERASADGGD